MISSIDQPPTYFVLVRRVRLPDGTEVEVPMTDDEAREHFKSLRIRPPDGRRP